MREKVIRAKGVVLYVGVLFVAGWYLLAFQSDIAQLSLTPILLARNTVLLAAVLSLFNYLLRIFRWHVYLGSLGCRFPLAFTGLTYIAGFAFTLSPGKVGEMVRARFYKDTGLPFSTTAAVFFVERLMDLLAMVALALFAFAASSGYTPLLWGSIVVMVTTLALLGGVPWLNFLATIDGHTRIPPVIRGLLTTLVRILISARTLLRPKLLAFSFLLGLCAWGAEGLGLMVLGTMVPSLSMDWATATGIYAVAIVVGALSFLPGGLGSTEVVMVALLAAHGYTMADAMLLTLVCRALTLWLAVALGWLAMFVLRYYSYPVFENS